MKLECLVCLFDLGFTLLSTIFQCTEDARVSDLFVCLIWVLHCFQQSFSVLIKLVCLVCLFDLGFTLLSTIFQCTNEARVSRLFVCLFV